MAAFEAVGYAKYGGGVGVCMATSGPGAVHLLSGLCDAKLDHVPVVAIVGQQPPPRARRTRPAGGRPSDAAQGRRPRVPRCHGPRGPGWADATWWNIARWRWRYCCSRRRTFSTARRTSATSAWRCPATVPRGDREHTRRRPARRGAVLVCLAQPAERQTAATAPPPRLLRPPTRGRTGPRRRRWSSGPNGSSARRKHCPSSPGRPPSCPTAAAASSCSGRTTRLRATLEGRSSYQTMQSLAEALRPLVSAR